MGSQRVGHDRATELNWTDGTRCHDPKFFLILSFKPAFSLSSFTLIRSLFSSSHSAIKVVSSAYLRFLVFLPAILIPACNSSSPAFWMMCSVCKWKCKLLSHVQLFATHGLYDPWNSPGQNTGVGSLSLLQGIFPTQGSNQGLLHCRQILYQMSHKGSPRILEWVAYTFSIGSSWPRVQTQVSCIAGKFFIMWATRGWHDCVIHYVLGFLSPLPQFSDSRNITKTKSPSYPENLSKKV